MLFFFFASVSAISLLLLPFIRIPPPPYHRQIFIDSSALAAFSFLTVISRQHYHQCLYSMGGLILLLLVLSEGAPSIPKSQHGVQAQKWLTRLHFHILIQYTSSLLHSPISPDFLVDIFSTFWLQCSPGISRFVFGPDCGFHLFLFPLTLNCMTAKIKQWTNQNNSPCLAEDNDTVSCEKP